MLPDSILNPDSKILFRSCGENDFAKPENLIADTITAYNSLLNNETFDLSEIKFYNLNKLEQARSINLKRTSDQNILNLFQMIYITQLIYIKEGQEDVFHQFENVAIPIISKYNGRLLLRIRPGENSFIEYSIDKPYEVHLVEFDTEQDFKNFMEDGDRKKFLHLKEQSIKTSILYKGTKL